ncbi:hypothetical protein ARTHRO9AX_220465 [Arthrobacter sp. 9AX]|nr:hypothetical protein ARTHRO9AX_220465 [Arthrobacter sp. 9AX]
MKVERDTLNFRLGINRNLRRVPCISGVNVRRRPSVSLLENRLSGCFFEGCLSLLSLGVGVAVQRTAFLCCGVYLPVREPLADGIRLARRPGGTGVAIVPVGIFAVFEIFNRLPHASGITVVTVHILPALAFQSGGSAPPAGLLARGFRGLSHGASLL